MRFSNVLAGLLGVAALGRPNLAAGQLGSVDTTGIALFWRLADRLVQGEEPSVSAWDSLFATPGYAALDARERRRPALVRGFRLAFNPALITERDSLLRGSTWTARVVAHVRDLPRRRAEIEAFSRAMVAPNGSVARAAKRTAAVLPKGTVERYGVPRIALIAFLPDGRGYPGLIVADAGHASARSGPALERFLAHEGLHYYRWALAAERPVGGRRQEQDSVLAAFDAVLGKIEEEGIADLFDKLPLLGQDSAALASAAGVEFVDYYRSYQVEMGQAWHRFGLLDAALASAIAEPSMARGLADSLAQALPLEGRPLGLSMARVIQSQLGNSAIRRVLGSGFEFLRAYDQAAGRGKCGCPRLSPQVREALASQRARH